MVTFVEAVKNTPVMTRTENGMKAQTSTLRETVNLFFNGGASRGKDITQQFERAFQEDSEVALRIAQWIRDIRGGAGERQNYRDILKHLERFHPEVLLETKILNNVAEIGRWDDLLIFETQEIKERAYTLIAMALGSGNSLCGKWCPRKGQVAVELRNFMGLTPKQYRKLLVKLTNVVESKMCAREFDSINFSHVPSVAMARYTKAFAKRAPEAFAAYKESLKNGDPSVKINASAVYPYDVIKNLNHSNENVIADAQWKVLPDYMNDTDILPMVDVSGSMEIPVGGYNSKAKITCLDVAVSLGLYCADKNKGSFKDLFLTFSSNSKLVHLKGSLSEKYHQMKRSEWGMSTNLHSAFNQILSVALTNKIAQEDMPKVLLIMSDMQFDACTRFDDSALQMIRRNYEQAGYEVPNVVFWNLNSSGNVPCSFNEQGVALVSGFSPSILKSVLAGDLESMTPEKIMLDTVMVDRYSV